MIKTLHREHLEIHSIDDFLANGYNFRNATIQGIDFSKLGIDWSSLDLHNAVLLGCKFTSPQISAAIAAGALIFPEVEGLPYDKYRSEMYHWQELNEELDGKSRDLRIYEHFSASKYNPSMIESLCQRIHDHAMDDALRDYLMPDSDGDYKHKCIGIMGGHGTLRSDPYFLKTALVCQKLAALGYTIVSGGGPGIMEAANLGAYFAKYSSQQLTSVVSQIAAYPHYTDAGYHKAAEEALATYTDGTESLAVPTWFYGHEPSNLFATHIAKYFSNSIREDTLLAICLHGILFSPGSAGTTQEIFMDAAQNHYATFGYYSPMIFMSTERYQQQTALYETLTQLAKGTGYESLVHISDDVEEVVQLFQDHPPIKAS